jgi:hypothetical protein
MSKFLTFLWEASRTSEFWIFLATASAEVVATPVPDEFKWAAWAYVGFRILSKIVKFVVPNPEDGSWMKEDG